MGELLERAGQLMERARTLPVLGQHIAVAELFIRNIRETSGRARQAQKWVEKFNGLPAEIRSSEIGRYIEAQIGLFRTNGDEKALEEVVRAFDAIDRYFAYEELRKKAQADVRKHYPEYLDASQIEFGGAYARFNYDGMDSLAIVEVFRRLPEERRSRLLGILNALRSPGVTDRDAMENPFLSVTGVDELISWVEKKRSSLEGSGLNEFLKEVDELEDAGRRMSVLTSYEARAKFRLAADLEALRVLDRIGPMWSILDDEQRSSATELLIKVLRGEKQRIEDEQRRMAVSGVEVAPSLLDIVQGGRGFDAVSAITSGVSMFRPAGVGDYRIALIDLVIRELGRGSSIGSVQQAVSLARQMVLGGIIGNLEELATTAGKAVIGGVQVDPLSGARQISDRDGATEVADKAAEIEGRIERVSLALSIDDSIAALEGHIRESERLAGESEKTRVWYKKEIGKLLGAYRKARRLLDAGDPESARKVFLEAYNSREGREVMEKFMASLSESERIKFTGRIAIITAAGFLSSLAAGAAAPWLASTFGLSHGQMSAAMLMIESGAFLLGDKFLNGLCFNEHFFDPERGISGNALDLGIEYIETALMFRFLGMFNRSYESVVGDILFRRAESRLIRSGVISAGEARTSRAAMAIVLERARLGALGRIAHAAGAFAAEYAGFTAWDMIRLTAHHIAGDMGIDPRSALSRDGMLERAKFLMCLKLSGFLSRPVTEKLRERTAGALYKRYEPELTLLAKEEEAALRALNDYLTSGRRDNSEIDVIYRRLRDAVRRRDRLISALTRSGAATIGELGGTEPAIRDILQFDRQLKILEDIAGLVTPRTALEWVYKAKDAERVEKAVEELRKQGARVERRGDGSFTIETGTGERIEIRKEAAGGRKTEDDAVFSSTDYVRAWDVRDEMRKKNPGRLFAVVEENGADGESIFKVIGADSGPSFYTFKGGEIRDNEASGRFSRYLREWLRLLTKWQGDTKDTTIRRNRAGLVLSDLLRIRYAILVLPAETQNEAIRFLTEMKPNTGIDNTAIANPLRSADPATALRYLQYFINIRKSLAARGIEASYDEVRAMTLDMAWPDIKTASREFFGRFDEGSAAEAVLFRTRLLREWFGIAPSSQDLYGLPHIPVTMFHMDNGMYVMLEFGKFESYAGLQFVLYAKNAQGYDVALATIGFHETGGEIAVNRYQGGKDIRDEMRDFRRFSGGVAPLPWLAYAVGRMLLGRAVRSGKQLKWISGEYVRMAYPHERGRMDVNSATMTEQDARDYLRGDGRFVQVPAAEFERTQRTIEGYNGTAMALGFTNAGEGGNPDTWFTFDVSRPERFGVAMAGEKGVNSAKFARSLEVFDRALGSATRPEIKSDGSFDPTWFINHSIRWGEHNPFTNEYAPYSAGDRTIVSAGTSTAEAQDARSVPDGLDDGAPFLMVILDPAVSRWLVRVSDVIFSGAKRLFGKGSGGRTEESTQTPLRSEEPVVGMKGNPFVSMSPARDGPSAAQRPVVVRDEAELESIRMHVGTVLAGLPYGPEITDLAERMYGTADPFRALNLFLRGELGREPRSGEVIAAIEKFRTRGIYSVPVFGNISSVGQPIFQIYTKEFLDAYTVRILEIRDRFVAEHGREPIIMEVAAGDGRLTRAVNKRLAEMGLGFRVTATDLAHPNIWGIEFPPDVRPMEAVEAARKADIILGSWMSAGEPYDRDVLVEMAGTEKQLMMIGQHVNNFSTFIRPCYDGATNSQAFYDYVSDPSNNVRVAPFEEFSNGRMTFSRLDFNDSNFAPTGVYVYRVGRPKLDAERATIAGSIVDDLYYSGGEADVKRAEASKFLDDNYGSLKTEWEASETLRREFGYSFRRFIVKRVLMVIDPAEADDLDIK